MSRFHFEALVVEWRGPSPFFFAPLPQAAARDIREVSRLVSYGWGVIPVAARINGVSFSTSLFPKDETYLLPIKAAVRRMAGVTAGDIVVVEMIVAGIEE